MPVRHTTDLESSLLRSPKASEGQGGALGEAEDLKRGNTVGVRDQVLDLVAGQGLKVSRVADNELLPTPNTMEHREIKTPEQIAELKEKSPGGYRNLREVVINEVEQLEENNLLPTPAVAHLRNHDEPIEDYLQRRQDFVDGKTKGMPGASLGVAVRLVEDGADWKTALMPTPTTRDYKDGSAEHERDGVVQTDTVARAIFNSGEILLPTPQVDDSKNTGHNQDRRTTLASEVWEAERATAWGKFEPAIRRWENVLGRQAPAPTKPDGREGAHRLSSEFTEWMMGLPAGWVTGCGLTRNEELKACGNGVVPQQAELALRILLEGISFEPAGGGQVMFPTPTVSDIFTDNLSSTQQKPGSMHSVTLPQAVRMVAAVEETN
jgi:hypothetical protein